MSRHDECPSCGINRKQELQSIDENGLMIEELCGRDRGKRTYTVTPNISSLINLVNVEKIAEQSGYSIKNRGKLGITAIRNGSDNLSVSFLTSGAATIVGAKNEDDALSIYKKFVSNSKNI
jgi:adenylyltransferase/sulfurtransferase